MNIRYQRFFKYICTSSLLGLGTALLADGLWFAVTGGIHIIDLSFTAPMVFLTCWCLGGVLSWFVYRYISRLALMTYLFSYLIFVIMSFIYGGYNDPSVKGWFYLCVLGYGVLCLPAYFVNSIYVIPNLFNIKS